MNGTKGSISGDPLVTEKMGNTINKAEKI